jgi:hypothetical protein
LPKLPVPYAITRRDDGLLIEWDSAGHAWVYPARALRLAIETQIPGLIALVHGSLSALMLRAERLEEAERHSSAAIAAYAPPASRK